MWRPDRGGSVQLSELNTYKYASYGWVVLIIYVLARILLTVMQFGIL